MKNQHMELTLPQMIEKAVSITMDAMDEQSELAAEMATLVLRELQSGLCVIGARTFIESTLASVSGLLDKDPSEEDIRESVAQTLELWGAEYAACALAQVVEADAPCLKDDFVTACTNLFKAIGMKPSRNDENLKKSRPRDIAIISAFTTIRDMISVAGRSCQTMQVESFSDFFDFEKDFLKTMINQMLGSSVLGKIFGDTDNSVLSDLLEGEGNALDNLLKEMPTKDGENHVGPSGFIAKVKGGNK